jgi:hypothetical protein
LEYLALAAKVSIAGVAKAMAPKPKALLRKKERLDVFI